MTYPEVDRALLADRICTHFEEQLKADNSPRIEFYLEDCSGEIREEVLRELLALELWYARERNKSLSIVDYLERFPDHQSIVRDCFTEDASPPSPDPDQNKYSTENYSNLESVDSKRARSRITMDLPPQFGRYRILKRLGEGGMGNVYLAEDEALDRQIALKVPRLSPANESGVLSRFRREAQAAARVVHPNLCPVYDIGEIEGIFFLTMAYIEGQSLADHIMQRRPINIRNMFTVIRKTAQALSAAHDKGVIHRDLKPSNIMINLLGEPVVVDFGLARTEVAEQARLTATGAIVGTPAYASPEQVESQAEIDSRTDIYSLGVIVYEVLTGRLPFQASSPLMLLQQILENDPPPPSSIRQSVPKELDDICLRAIAKRPEDRFQTMQEFDDALAESEAKIIQTTNSCPDWFGQTLVTTPSQVGHVSSMAASAKQTDDSQSAKTTNTWRAQAKKFSQNAAGRMRSFRPSAVHAFWFATAVLLIAVAFLLPTPGNAPKVVTNSPVPEPPVSEPPEWVPPVSKPPGQKPPEQKPPGPNPPEPFVAPDFRAEFPDQVGAWTRLSGTLWHFGLPEKQKILFEIELRSVFSDRIDGHEVQDLEIEVRTTDSDLDPDTPEFQEQASLRIDVDHYRQFRKIKVLDGHVRAGDPRVALEDRVFKQFDLEFDNIAWTYDYKDLKPPLPPNRLSIQDVLAILFKQTGADTTHELYVGLHRILRNQRLRWEQGITPNQKVINGIPAKFYMTESPSDVPGEDSVKYQLALSDKVPFNWIHVSIEDPRAFPLMTASMDRETISGHGATRRFLPPDALGGPPPRVLISHMSLPDTEGAWARYDATLLIRQGATIPDPVKLDRVEVRVLNQEMVSINGTDVPYRWIEVETQLGASQDPRKIVETALLLVDDKSYREDDRHPFTVARGYVRCKFRDAAGDEQELLAKFDPDEDRLEQRHPGELPDNRFPIRNVLSLAFGAKVISESMNFDARTRISHALMDDDLKRIFEQVHKPYDLIDGKRALKCIEVRPVSDVPLPGRGDNLPATSLSYVIKVSEECPWGWLSIDLTLLMENRLVSLFEGDLTLRDFGVSKDPARSFPNDEVKIRLEDPEEKDADREYALALQLEKQAKILVVRKRYQRIVDLHPETLAAEKAKERLKIIGGGF